MCHLLIIFNISLISFEPWELQITDARTVRFLSRYWHPAVIGAVGFIG